MYYRPGQSMTFDSDGLQADVMRFMAIIAFCLIAILALVKNVEPPLPAQEIEKIPEFMPPVEQAQSETFVPHPALEPMPDLSPVFDAKPVRVPIEIAEPAAPLSEAEVATVYKQQPQALFQEQPQTFYEEPPQALEEPQPSYEETPRVLEEPQPFSEETPQTAYEEQPQALALRFATDDVFVALISTKKIQLFARTDDKYYLMGANFGVTPASAAGALYDLLPDSIPRKISRIFNRVISADGYLVALPGDMQSELNRYLRDMSGDSQSGGTLVIHRNGHISYEK